MSATILSFSGKSQQYDTHQSGAAGALINYGESATASQINHVFLNDSTQLAEHDVVLTEAQTKEGVDPSAYIGLDADFERACNRALAFETDMGEIVWTQKEGGEVTGSAKYTSFADWDDTRKEPSLWGPLNWRNKYLAFWAYDSSSILSFYVLFGGSGQLAEDSDAEEVGPKLIVNDQASLVYYTGAVTAENLLYHGSFLVTQPTGIYGEAEGDDAEWIELPEEFTRLGAFRGSYRIDSGAHARYLETPSGLYSSALFETLL